MTLEQLEAEVLALPKDSQVILLARLLERLCFSGGFDYAIAQGKLCEISLLADWADAISCC